MAFLRKASFSSGELDPALWERTNLEKYQTGLATLRNAFIGKTGRIVSRSGTKYVETAKYEDKACVIVSPPYDPILIEWGHEYVRTHYVQYGSDGSPALSYYTEDAHDWTEFDLPSVQFIFNGRYAYIFCEGKKMKKMVVGTLEPLNPPYANRFLADADKFYMPPAKSITNISFIGVTGYPVDYVVTYVLNGQESATSGVLGVGFFPDATGNKNTVRLIYTTSPTSLPLPSEIKVYRRPKDAGAFGYIGSSSASQATGGNIVYDFIDLGGGADYSHAPPALSIENPGVPTFAYGRTGTVYQQRLIITEQKNPEAIHCSRPGYQNNFTRDYPLDSDSSLSFKAGTSGNAKVLRMIDSNGLIVFTTAGIFASEPGALTPNNIALDKKGNWVIDEGVPPLEIPGGIIFVDKSTNTIRSLVYSNEAGGYPGEELSIFSNHLFLGKRVVSWSFQDGDVPLIWVIFDDGSLISLTYQREHQMQAWSRHDSNNASFECTTTVRDITNKATTYFLVKRGNKRLIECTTPRFANEVKAYSGSDSCLMWDFTLNALTGGTSFNLIPQNPLDWTGLLQLNASNGAFVDTAGNGAIGTTWRVFDKQGSAVDLVVTQYLNDTTLIVQPSVEFPFDQATNITLQLVTNVVGLDPGFGYGKLNHLEGQLVSVLVDGYVISSPNNNIENYPDIRVIGGAVTLPNGLKGAFIRIGVPFTSDVETLNVDSVEQKPTLLESKIANKVYISVYRTRGIYVGSTFPANDVLTDEVDAGIQMEDPEHRDEVIDVGNAAQKLITTRYEINIPNDWDSNGKIAIRQVDPLPFEILSIIPDLTIPS